MMKALAPRPAKSFASAELATITQTGLATFLAAAITRVIAAARKVAKPVCVMVASSAEAKDFAGLGASAFIISSDQSQMRRAAAQTLTDFKTLVQTTDASHVSQH